VHDVFFFIGVLIIIEFALLKSLLFAMLYKRIDCRNWWVDLGSSTAVVRELLWIPWRSWSCFVLMRASIRKIKLVMWHFVKWNLNVQYKNQGIVRMNWLLLEFWFGDGYHVVIDVRVTCIIFKMSYELEGSGFLWHADAVGTVACMLVITLNAGRIMSYNRYGWKMWKNI
jgi:hypothetical protein